MLLQLDVVTLVTSSWLGIMVEESRWPMMVDGVAAAVIGGRRRGLAGRGGHGSARGACGRRHARCGGAVPAAEWTGEGPLAVRTTEPGVGGAVRRIECLYGELEAAVRGSGGERGRGCGNSAWA